MKITTKLAIDMAKRQILEKVDAVQCDANTRAVAVTLTAGGLPWMPGDGLTVSVACKKPDRTSAWFDKLPDGTAACSVAGNVVTAILAPEVLTAAGQVQAAIVFQDESLNQLATFPFVIDVAENPAAGSVISKNYYNLQTLAEINEDIDSIHDVLAKHAMYFDQQAGDIQQNMRKIDELVYKFGAVEASAAQVLKATAIVCTAEGEQIEVNDSAEYPLQSLTVYGKSVQDGTPAPDAPVPIVSAGAENGCISLYIPQAYNGAAIIRNPRNVSAPIGEMVRFDVMAAGPGLTYQWQFNDGYAWSNTNVTGYDTPSLAVQALEYRIGYQYRCKVTAADGSEAISAAAALSRGEAVSYGAYTYGEAPQLRIDTPGGLLGIPVSDGGNYTDESGQQWISDVVRSSGQKEQNVGYIASYAGEDIPGPYISSTGDLSIGAEVLYALAEPVITEIADMSLPSAYKPNTTIINDAGAGMKVEYVADPKTYYDNKFAQLAASLLGG